LGPSAWALLPDPFPIWFDDEESDV
jgi:hypothetical protein